MRISRLLPILLLVGASVLTAAPAEAAPGSGCPNGFMLAPISVLGDDFDGNADQVNNDGMVCIRFVRPGIGIFIDNTAP
jgi:hypothetical protein